MKPNKYIYYFLLVVLSLVFGTLIYVLFRPENTIFLQWLNISERANTSMKNLHLFSTSFSSFFVNSLPDGLWTFSLMNFLLLIWKSRLSQASMSWLILASVTAFYFEFGQLYNFVPGTFDIGDLSMIILSLILPFLIFKQQLKFQHYENL